MKEILQSAVGLLLAAFTISCSSNAEVINTAKEYTEKHICTLFEDATLFDEEAGTAEFIKGEKKKSDYKVGLTTKNNIALQRARGFENRMAMSNVLAASQSALIDANEKEGFYVVSLGITYKDTMNYSDESSTPPLNLIEIDIFISKDGKVLNRIIGEG